jgi:ADP-glucose pyrophosphorylase
MAAAAEKIALAASAATLDRNRSIATRHRRLPAMKIATVIVLSASLIATSAVSAGQTVSAPVLPP